MKSPLPKLVFFLLCAAAPSLNAATRLDATIESPISVADDFEFTPDGKFLVVRGAAPNDGPAELYSLTSNGGFPTRLSANLPSGQAISGWELSPDGGHLVYFADQDTAGLKEVFVVPMPTGDFYKVNDLLVEAGTKAVAFAGTDGSHVAYIAGKVTGPFTGTFYELFSVPVAGGESMRLSGPLVNGGDVQEILVSDQDGRVLYLADQETDEKLELYSVSVAEGNPVKLNDAIGEASDVLADGLAFSPDGNRVIFQVVHRPQSLIELYSVPASGGDPVTLHPTLPEGGDVTAGSQQFSPDGSRVLYHADQNVDEVFEIFSVPAGGGESQRLNGPLVVGGDVRAEGAQFNPDSQQVIYTADQEVDERFELYRVPSAGGDVVKLSGEMIAGGDVQEDLAFSSDGALVLFRADRLVDEVFELFSTPTAGGSPTRLNAPLVIGGDVVRAEFTPDGSEVVYLADQDVDQVFELYAVAASGGTARKLSGELVPGGDVVDWHFSPDGNQLVYRADQDIDGTFQLYSVDWLVGSPPLPGDFNLDGTVDAADYTKWRDGLGTLYTATDYDHWKSNFGRTGGAAATAHGFSDGNAASVPEPATHFAFFAVAALGLAARRQSSQSFSSSRAGTYSSVT